MSDLSSLCKQYHLPSQDQLNQELGIFSFEEKDDILYELIKLLREKIGVYISFMQHVLQPDSQMIELQEAGGFSQADREEVYELFQVIVGKQRQFYEVYLSPNEEAYATYFKELFTLWNEKKEQVRAIVKKGLGTWAGEVSLQERQGYFG